MAAQALAGIRVLDLTRILAGPTCTQLLGDLGADIVKIEKPGEGDDTRKWGPPYVEGKDGRPTRESAYYLSANRNKRSVAIDIAHPEGQRLVRELLGGCQVLVGELQGRRPRPLRARLCEPRPGLPGAGLLLGHRLRPDRPLRAPSRLRLPGAGLRRHHERHRRAATASR